MEEMESLLGSGFPEYLAAMGEHACSGLRVNTLKWTPREAEEKLAGLGEKVPWTENGFYCDAKGGWSGHPYYYAGLYYLQEPSAMAPARFLPVEPGDRVLDLCAAPGGKSTELGARLRGKGLLFANDLSASRAGGLLKNLERFGIPNICVAAESPERLRRAYPEYFDKILADAPCSGEGMFRKNPAMARDRQKRGPDYYAPLQREILEQAWGMLKPGGYLLYSTCTFSPVENEENVGRLLARFPDAEPVPLPLFPGACEGFGLPGCIRMYPHRLRGEGHFLALIRRKGGTAEAEAGAARGETAKGENMDGAAPGPEAELADFLAGTKMAWDADRFLFRGGNVCYLPEDFVPAKGLRYLRTGLLVGTVRNGRFEPSQAFAMVLNRETYGNRVSFEASDERVVRYLKGETIALKDGEPDAAGRCLVCVDGFPLGFAAVNGGSRSLKNKYCPGWRMM